MGLVSIEKIFLAVKWKLQNIQKLKEKNPDKHTALYDGLMKKLND